MLGRARVAAGLRRSGLYVTAAAVALLPLQGIERRPILVPGGLIAFDACLAVAAVLSLPQLWGSWRLLGRPAAWLPLGLAGVGVVTELLQPQAHVGRRIAEQAAPLIAALVIAVHEQGPVRRSALVGGTIALVASLAGWGADVALGLGKFSYEGAHPIFAQLPRLSGTFHGSPQRCGSFAVFYLCVVLSLAGTDTTRRRVLRWCGAVGVLALLLSMSYAWVGGLMLAALAVPARWRSRALTAAALVTLVASIPISIGPRSVAIQKGCHELDSDHYVVTVADPEHCTRPTRAGRAVTLYSEAKRASLRAFVSAPWRGVGFTGFAEFSRQAFRTEYGQQGSHYEQPHGILHGLAAKHGVLGLLLFPLFAWALRRGWRNSPWDWGVLAFATIGLHLDVDRLRELWVLWGFLLGAQAAGGGLPAGGAQPLAMSEHLAGGLRRLTAQLRNGRRLLELRLAQRAHHEQVGTSATAHASLTASTGQHTEPQRIRFELRRLQQ